MPIITKALPSQERLRELFDYESNTGNLIWKVRPESHFKNQRGCNIFNAMYANKVAGSINKATGYRYISIDNVNYLAHRLTYAYVHGACPFDKQIDHRDGDRLNNRIENLRVCSSSENRHNRGKHCTNTTGFKGVSWQKRCQKFTAAIFINGKRKHLGYFTTAEQAAATYKSAAIVLHGEFAHPSVLANPFALITGPALVGVEI